MRGKRNDRAVLPLSHLGFSAFSAEKPRPWGHRTGTTVLPGAGAPGSRALRQECRKARECVKAMTALPCFFHLSVFPRFLRKSRDMGPSHWYDGATGCRRTRVSGFAARAPESPRVCKGDDGVALLFPSPGFSAFSAEKPRHWDHRTGTTVLPGAGASGSRFFRRLCRKSRDCIKAMTALLCFFHLSVFPRFLRKSRDIGAIALVRRCYRVRAHQGLGLSGKSAGNPESV